MRFPDRPSGRPAYAVLAPVSRGCPPLRGQVIHVLLTRPPLYSGPEGPFRVRLACVRRAASVDSEPGSNSRLKSPGQPGRAPRGAPARRRERFGPESDEVVLHVQPICERSAPPRIAPPERPPKGPPAGPRGGPALLAPRGARKTAAPGASAPESRRLPSTLALPRPARKPNLRYPESSSRTESLPDLGTEASGGSPRGTGRERAYCTLRPAITRSPESSSV